MLNEAADEGRRIATGNDERSIASSSWNLTQSLAGRAASVVSNIVGQIKEKLGDLIDFATGKANADIDDWATNYSNLVSVTEVSGAIEATIYDEATKSGATQKWWLVDPDACPICQTNADASPIAMSEAFPDGSMQPLAHPRCRCTALYE